MKHQKRLVLKDVRIKSFITTLETNLLEIKGGISGGDCPATEIEGCTDSNRCGSGCGGMIEV